MSISRYRRLSFALSFAFIWGCTAIPEHGPIPDQSGLTVSNNLFLHSRPVTTSTLRSWMVKTVVDFKRDEVEPDPNLPGMIAAEVQGVTSTSVSIGWGSVPDAAEIRVFVAPEPSSLAGDPLPARVLAATFDGSANGHLLTGLAPGVDVFIQVEADTQSGPMEAVLHARTMGGPRVELDSPVRAVHALSPRMLQVVMANGQGSTWQGGPWVVRRADGRAIAVTAVHRHSIPVSAPDYDIGYGARYTDTVIDADHRIHLVLGEAMSSPEMLDITGPQGVSFRLAFSDRYLETPVIQLNQVGYNPRATERWAYVSAFLGDGGFLDLSAIPSHAEVLAEAVDPTMPREVVLAALPVTSRSTQDKDAGGAVKEINLASLPAAEDLRYRVRLPGVGVSWPTEVSERAASKAFVTVTRGLLYNRWGGPTELVCNQWGRPADHATVYTAELGDFLAKFPSTQPKVGERRLEGGYHDAGDFDQRPMHTVVPQLLLRAFEMDPERYTDGQLNLPESGNGIPDLLDEALWGVAAWEQLQEADGGVRMGVESHRHPWGFYLAHTDPLPYWTYSRCPKVSARAAGLFAQASRLLAPFDSSRAANLRERAVKAYAYAKSMGGAKAYLLFGAGELYRLTGQDSYRQDFEAQWAAMGSYGVFSNFSTTHLSQADYGNGNRAMGDFILAYLGSQGASSAMRSTTITNLDKFSNEVSSRIRSSHAHRSPRPANYNWDWGQGTHTARYMDPIVSRLQIGGLSAAKQQEYFNTMSLAADYVLGGNPDGRVYFTGLGSRPAEEPLHLDSLVFAKMGRGPVPGIPVYGPVEGLPAASYMAATKAAFHPSVDQLPRAMRFGDVRTLVNNTEFTVWESQAPFAQLFAMLSGPDA